MDDKQKQRSLQRIVRRIVQNERLKNKYNALRNTAIQVTRSFDQEVEARKKEQEKKIADAFQKMIRWSRSLELENEKQLVREEAEARRNEKNIDKVKRKIPRKIRNFPAAFKRNPRAVTLAVIKYFLGMILGRVLAIVLYILMTFIPSLPIPDAVANMSKPPEFLSSMRNFFTDSLSSMRSFFTDFNPQMIVTTVKNIPADINNLIQNVGYFFTFYVKPFIVRVIQNPQRTLQDVRKYVCKKAPMFMRFFVCVAFSFLLIKLVIIFLLPVFGGIALTVLGIKVSIILFVIVRMIADKIGELLGKYIFNNTRNISKSQLLKIICGYLRKKIFGKS